MARSDSSNTQTTTNSFFKGPRRVMSEGEKEARVGERGGGFNQVDRCVCAFVRVYVCLPALCVWVAWEKTDRWGGRTEVTWLIFPAAGVLLRGIGQYLDIINHFLYPLSVSIYLPVYLPICPSVYLSCPLWVARRTPHKQLWNGR